MILHELATNAAKYGALSIPDGRIEFRWTLQDDGTVELVWTESGLIGLTAPPSHGFGTRMIALTVRDLAGESASDWRPEGLRFQLRFKPD